MSVLAYSVTGTAGAVKSAPGLLYGFVLAAGGAAAVSLRDGGATSAQIVMLQLGGAGTVVWHPFGPVGFGTTLHFTIESGTPTVSVAYV